MGCEAASYPVPSGATFDRSLRQSGRDGGGNEGAGGKNWDVRCANGEWCFALVLENHMGLDHGFLFQDSHRSRAKSEQISYEWYEKHPKEKEELAEHEAAFVRPLCRALPRLDLLGYTLDAARAEYDPLRRRRDRKRFGIFSASGSGLLVFR
jgi:hypothetical protein